MNLNTTKLRLHNLIVICCVLIIQFLCAQALYAQGFSVFRDLSNNERSRLSTQTKQNIARNLERAEVIHHRLAYVDVSKFNQLLANKIFSFELFPGQIFNLKVTWQRSFPDHTWAHTGEAILSHPKRQLPGQFTVTSEGEYLAMELHQEELAFSVVGVGEGVHLILSINPLKFPKEGDPLKPDKSIDPLNQQPRPWVKNPTIIVEDEVERHTVYSENKNTKELDWEERANWDNGNVLDMLVVYSNATEVQTPDIRTQIKLAVALANTAYFNSNIHTRMRLVGIYRMAYTETNNFNTELNRLASGSDGFNDDVFTLRTLYGADFVAMVSTIVAGLCGLAQLGTYPADNTRVFSVTATSCITSYTFAHEVGHNMGNDHVSPGSGIFAYSHGFFSTAPAIDFRTIMSTSTECAGCIRQNFFSNPDYIFQGISCGDVGTADVRTSINTTSKVMARYRSAVTVFNDDPQEDAFVNKGCFIATAAYGSELDSKVVLFKKFRDQVLAKSQPGRGFVRWYYKHSPQWAQRVAQSHILRWLARSILTPIAWILELWW